MQYRHELLVLETMRHRIAGTVTLAKDGYRSRVSDLLNAAERDFVSLTDVTITPLNGQGEIERHAFLAVNRHQVVFALLPDGDGSAPAAG